MANRILTKGRYTVPTGSTWAIQSGKGQLDLISPTIGLLNTVKLGEIRFRYQPDNAAITTTDATSLASLRTALNSRRGYQGIPVTEGTIIEVKGSSVAFVEDAPIVPLGLGWESVNGAGVASERTVSIRDAGQGTFARLNMVYGDGSATLRVYSDNGATILTDTVLVDLNTLVYPFELDRDFTGIGALDIEVSSGSYVLFSGDAN